MTHTMRMPKPKPKPIHRAKHMDADGNVSPLCATTPRAIDLRRATWTNRDDAVTCPKCIAALSLAKT